MPQKVLMCQFIGLYIINEKVKAVIPFLSFTYISPLANGKSLIYDYELG